MRELSELFVIIRAKTDEFEKDMKKLDLKKAAKIAEGVAFGAAAAIVGTTVAATKGFADSADSIQEMSQRTGLSTKLVQELGYALKLTGGDTQGLETATKRLQVALFGATNTGADVTDKMNSLQKELQEIEKSEVDDKITEVRRKMMQVDPAAKNAAQRIADYNAQIEKIKKDSQTSTKIKAIKEQMSALQDASEDIPTAFEKLNIKIEDLKNLSPDEQFLKVAQAVASIKDPSERAALAVAVFGKTGTELLPMLENGAAGLAKYRKEANDLGAVMSDTAINKGAALKDSMDKLDVSFKGLSNTVGEIFAEDMKIAVDNITECIKQAREWIKVNPDIVRTIRDIAVAVIALIVVLKVFAIAQAIATAAQGWVGIAALIAGAIAAAAAVAGIEALFSAKTAEIPAMAAGGIVTRPTMAMIGEAGPEAVIPWKDFSGNQEIHTHVYLDGEQIAEVVDKHLYNQVNPYGVKGYV
ncbi:phage tail tape measure protein [Candidatus Pacearchaeota archaeon]|jgi:TP901 family phage tail tape measure protein|nr:phage tail tape measure protein [Candidatus Pacearchaeota archaeon]